MVWNIGQAYIAELPKMTKEFLRSGYSIEHTNEICNAIKELAPDFVLLQEVPGPETGFKQFSDLMKCSGYAGVLGPAYRFQDYVGHVAIFFKSQTPDRVENLEQAIVAHVPESNLTLSSVHLDSYDPNNAKAQLALAVSKLPAERAILGGDFNMPAPQAHRVFKNLGKPFVSGTSNFAALTGWFGFHQLDGIFVSPDLNVKAKILRKLRWGAMDHCPIFATVDDKPS